MQEELLERLGGQACNIVRGVLLDGGIVDEVVGQSRKSVRFEGVEAVFSYPGK